MGIENSLEKIAGKEGLDDHDSCVSCGTPTEYSIHTPIDIRDHYVEGAGQLCKTCYDKVYGPDPNCCSR